MREAKGGKKFIQIEIINMFSSVPPSKDQTILLSDFLYIITNIAQSGGKFRLKSRNKSKVMIIIKAKYIKYHISCIVYIFFIIFLKLYKPKCPNVTTRFELKKKPNVPKIC